MIPVRDLSNPLLIKPSGKGNVFRTLYLKGDLTAKEITKLLYKNKEQDKNLKNVRVYLNRLEKKDGIIERSEIRGHEIVYKIKDDAIWYGDMKKSDLIREIRRKDEKIKRMKRKIEELVESEKIVEKIMQDIEINERTNEERELRDFKKSRAIAIMKQIKDEKGFVDYQEWLKEAGMEKISDVIVDDAIEQLFIMNPENFIEINKWQKYQYTGK